MTESIATASELRAGPVRLTFKDGELRYLKVGDREIVRRIYFCIRQADWDPPMPQFELIELTRRQLGNLSPELLCGEIVACQNWFEQ